MDRLKLHAFWNSLANNVATPFVGFNVTVSGASAILIGYVQAIGSLASSVTQLLGGRIADRSGKRIAIAMMFSVVTGVLWLGSALNQNPEYLAVLFTAITLALGFYASGWTSLVGEASEGRARGYFLGTFARVIYMGALAALLLTTALTAYYPSPAALYLLAGAFFIFSAMILVGQKEQHIEKKSISTDENASLRKYYVATGVYGLFWGFAWPLFTITTVNIVHADLFQYSLAQVIAVASTIGFQPVIGRFVDRSRKRGVFWGRMGLVVYPVVYMFMTSVWQLYVLNILSGVTNSLLNVAFVAYLYDISPAGQRGRYNAEFNLVNGVSTMIGSVSAGFALVFLTTWNSLWLSLAYLYVISAVGRAGGALLHLKLPYGPRGQVPQGTVLR